MAKRLTLAVMAAGLGSRFDGSKQWADVGPTGEALLDYAIFDAISAGFDRTVLVVRAEDEAGLQNRMERTVGRRCPVEFAVQRLDDTPDGFGPPVGRSKPWGTGHAVWSSRELIDEPFAVINADDYYGPGAFAAMAGFLRTTESAGNEHAMVEYRLDDTLSDHGRVSRGVCTIRDGRWLEEIVEMHGIARRGGAISAGDEDSPSTLRADTTVSMNLWGFQPSIFEELGRAFESFLATLPDGEPEFALSSAINRLLASSSIRVKALLTDETWFGLTYREDLARVRAEIERRIEEGQYPVPLWGSE